MVYQHTVHVDKILMVPFVQYTMINIHIHEQAVYGTLLLS
jgi:hypothetical protein